MPNITGADIENAIYGVTGNPDIGPVADITPKIIEAIKTLLADPAPAKENRVVKATEERKTGE